MRAIQAWRMPLPDFPFLGRKTQKIRVISPNSGNNLATN